MKIEEIKSKILGKWLYDDGKIIEFLSGEDFEVTTINGYTTPNCKIVFAKKDDIITFTMIPIETVCIFKLIDAKHFIYDSLELNGDRNERILSRI